MSPKIFVFSFSQPCVTLVSRTTFLFDWVLIWTTRIIFRIAFDTELCLQFGVVLVALVVSTFQAVCTVIVTHLLLQCLKSRYTTPCDDFIRSFAEHWSTSFILMISRTILQIIIGRVTITICTRVALKPRRDWVNNWIAAVAFTDMALVRWCFLIWAEVCVADEVAWTTANRLAIRWKWKAMNQFSYR